MPRTIPVRIGKADQSGAIGGLADVALAVVVGTLTLVGVVGFFQSSSSQARTNSDLSNFSALVANIRAAYLSAGNDYTEVSTAAVISGKVAPPALVGNGALRNSFGGAVTVAGPTAGSFTVTYANLPKEACIRMVSATTAAGTVQLMVAPSGGGGTTLASLPPSMVSAAAACSDPSNNTVTWTLN